MEIRKIPPKIFFILLNAMILIISYVLVVILINIFSSFMMEKILGRPLFTWKEATAIENHLAAGYEWVPNIAFGIHIDDEFNRVYVADICGDKTKEAIFLYEIDGLDVFVNPKLIQIFSSDGKNEILNLDDRETTIDTIAFNSLISRDTTLYVSRNIIGHSKPFVSYRYKEQKYDENIFPSINSLLFAISSKFAFTIHGVGAVEASWIFVAYQFLFIFVSRRIAKKKAFLRIFILSSVRTFIVILLESLLVYVLGWLLLVYLLAPLFGIIILYAASIMPEWELKLFPKVK